MSSVTPINHKSAEMLALDASIQECESNKWACLITETDAGEIQSRCFGEVNENAETILAALEGERQWWDRFNVQNMVIGLIQAHIDSE